MTIKEIVKTIEKELHQTLNKSQRYELIFLINRVPESVFYMGYGLVESLDNYFRDKVNQEIRSRITVSALSGKKESNKKFSLYDYMCAGYGLDLSLFYIENHKYYKGTVVFNVEFDLSNIPDVKDKDDIIIEKIAKKLKIRKK